MKIIIFSFLIFIVFNSTGQARESFNGTYDLEVNIAGELFHDVFRIDRIGALASDGVVTGDFEVPGVFRAPFFGDLFGTQVRGVFTAVEGEQRFDVTLIADLTDVCAVTGTLLQGGEVFGDFEGQKRGCDDTGD